ncbi:hypothetical protein VNO77_03323 [Canavalia gladiata]|uniref:Uncharacterized protein n=1 Tax=Canavalia gladiata TaxID=3824 RepID=A0AAN9MUN5_CANGL
MVGSDFGLVNIVGQSTSSIAELNKWSYDFQQAMLDTIRRGEIPISSDSTTFSPLIVVAQVGDIEALKTFIKYEEFDLNYQDDGGFSAVMHAASQGHVESFRSLVYVGVDVKLCNKFGETAITLSEMNKNSDFFDKVVLEFELEKGNCDAGGFYALHHAACRGDLDVVTLLTSKGYDVNVPDGEDYTRLMLIAREGHASICELLISHDAHCGAYVQKNTKGGKGSPHGKQIRMLGSAECIHHCKEEMRIYWNILATAIWSLPKSHSYSLVNLIFKNNKAKL